MGTEFIRKAARTFKKSWDRRRVELATANLFTQQPCAAARTAEADLVGNARLHAGEAASLVFRRRGCPRSSALQPSILSAARKASCGISILPIERIRFLPAFCFSKSLRLRVTSPP
jgi:hypothetical protein